MLTKKEIRKRILATRDALPREEIREKSRIIAGRLRELTEYHQAKIIMFYASYGSEVETGNMMETALRDNHRIALPLVKEEENSLEVILIKAPERDISPGFKGIPEPINMPGRRLSTGDPDIIIVPGAAFDMGGKRIGMGKAYYDNFLRTVRPDTRKIALAFEKQIIDSIPSESHDVKMDLIITEKRVVYCG